MRSVLITTLLATAALAGCTGSSTYGTGKTSEQQLLRGFGGLLSVGQGSETTRIDYDERPELVKPANPTLVEPVAAAPDANFPVDDDARRLALRGDTSNIDPETGQLTAEFRGRRNGRAVTGRRDGRAVVVGEEDEVSRGLALRRDKEASAKRRAKYAAANGTATGAGPRKYLTQPPVEYRKPFETAPTGELGETEDSKALAAKREKETSVWKKLNPFD